MAANQDIRTCDFCGEQFCAHCTDGWTIEDGETYCSDACQAEAEQLHQDQQRDEDAENRAINR